MSDRIESIRAMLAKDPEDTFLLYSLAMEYAAGRRFDEAAETFNKCIAADEAYLPAYVECGKALRAAGRADQARRTFAAARELAAAQGENHVGDYVRQQLEALGQ